MRSVGRAASPPNLPGIQLVFSRHGKRLGLVAVLFGVGLLVNWREHGLADTLVLTTVVVALVVEFGLFLLLLRLGLGIFRKRVTTPKDLLAIAALAVITALLHTLTQVPLGLVTKLAAAMAALFFTVITVFHRQ